MSTSEVDECLTFDFDLDGWPFDDCDILDTGSGLQLNVDKAFLNEDDDDDAKDDFMDTFFYFDDITNNEHEIIGKRARSESNCWETDRKRLKVDGSDSLPALPSYSSPHRLSLGRDDDSLISSKKNSMKISSKEKNKRYLEECRVTYQAFRSPVAVPNKVFTPEELLNLLTENKVIPQLEIDEWSRQLHPENRSNVLNRIYEAERYYKSYGKVDPDFYDSFLGKRYRIDQHKLGRYHSMPAVFYMMMAAILYDARLANSNPLTQEQQKAFEDQYSQTLLSGKVSKQHARHTHLKPALLLCFQFLTCLLSFLPLDGHLEILLLIASCIEGRGVHHQRSGKKLSFAAKCYRVLLETMGPNGKSFEQLAAELPIVTSDFI